MSLSDLFTQAAHNPVLGLTCLLVLAVVLFVLALVLAVEACQTIFGHKKPAASK